jgi:hypothetical protein
MVQDEDVDKCGKSRGRSSKGFMSGGPLTTASGFVVIYGRHRSEFQPIWDSERNV